MRHNVTKVLWVTILAAVSPACDTIDTNRQVEGYSSFGAAIYREGCQRIAYTGELADQAAGLRQTVDVDGSLGRAVCVNNTTPPSDAPQKLFAIVAQKPGLIAVVDQILPKDILSDLQDFLVAITVLADDGTMENAIDSLGQVLGILHDDPDFPGALARLAHRIGYRPTKTAAGLVHTVIEYPDIDNFIGKALSLIAVGGTAETEWKGVMRAVSRELRAAKPVANPADPERTLKLALNLLFDTSSELASGKPRPMVTRDYRGMALPTAVSAPFVDNDGDGLADIDTDGHFVDANGVPLVGVATPFPELGNPDTASRDSLGQALDTTGGPLYQFKDLDPTVIAGLTREGVTLLDQRKNITFSLMYGMGALLGPRASQTKMYTDAAGGMIDALTYQGYDTSQAAVLDLMHAFIQVLGDPNAQDTLLATRTLLTQYESPTSRVVGAMLDASDRGKKHPEAMVPATSTVYDDLAPIIVRILRVPGLAEDLLTAMENPHVAGLGPMMARLAVARNQIDFDHTNGPGYPLTSNLDGIDPVDRTMADVDYNRSLLQRIAHLVHDANQAQFCNFQGADPQLLGFIPLGGPYDKCQMFEVDDLALLFVLNMASDSIRMDSSRYATTYSKASFREQLTSSTLQTLTPDNGIGDVELETLTGITGFQRFPSPAALARALFLRPSEQSSFMQQSTEPVQCIDGDNFTDVHDLSLFAWETSMVGNPSGYNNDTFYDAVRPLVDAFAKHDECVAYDTQSGNCIQLQNAAKIFIDLLAKLHEHWSSPAGSYFGHTYQSSSPSAPRYAHTDNIVSYEPLVAEVLGQSDLMPALLGLAPTLNSMTIDGTGSTAPAKPTLIATARYVFDPDATPGLAYRDGSTGTVQSDGVTPVPKASIYYLIADAYAKKRASLAGAPMDQSNAWSSATSSLVDQMLTVVQSGGGWQLQNRHMHGVTVKVLDFVRGRLASHDNTGDTSDWVATGLTQDLTDMLGGPTVAALTDFAQKVMGDQDARDQLYGLLSYLVDEASNDLAFQTALTSLADQMQSFQPDNDLIPIARVMGTILDPDKGTLDPQTTLLKRAHDLDSKKVLITILRNLYNQAPDGTYPAGTLADILSEINRTKPGIGTPMEAGDYKTLLGEVSTFFSDEWQGFTHFVNIVKNRGPAN
jgi:hypothetical protein